MRSEFECGVVGYAVHTTVLVAAVVLAGCNSVGPRTIKGARFNYNEAIADSWDQQLLLNLVRLRYRDTPFFLEVNSVSTQYSMTYTAGVSPDLLVVDGSTRAAAAGADLALGMAPQALNVGRGATGSLSKQKNRSRQKGVDVDTSIAYYERPTVLYTPLQGQKFVKQMLSPIPLEAVMMMSESGWSIERVFRLCLQEMNGLDNAATASGPTPATAPRYADFMGAAKLMRCMQLEGTIAFATELENETPRIVLDLPPVEDSGEEAKELRALLRLDPELNDFAVTQSRYLERPDSISVRTRSLLGVMYLLSQGVEPPDHHCEQGRVTVTAHGDGTPFNWEEVTGDLLRVRSQNSRPNDAYTKVHYRGTWFYIDDADLDSKSTFGLLSYLFYLQAGDIQSITPALTLPIGG